MQLLNTAKRHLDGGEHQPIEARSLNYYANPQLCNRRYRSFTVRKKSGGERIIHAPTRGLKSILRALNHVLQCVSEPHRAATGFVPNKCIRDNAAQHIGALYVYNLDLKDFFHSFDRNRVKLGFMSEPFGLRDEREPLAFLLASLCTHPFEMDGELRAVLPQGSPASPTITNILCRTLDRRLSGMAKRFGVKYTRYADDITFSSMTNVFRTKEFQVELKRIIEEDQSLVINPAKTRMQTEQYRQEVTGLTVNEKVNVPRRYVKQVRMYLYYWEKYGYQKAQSLLARNYPADRGHARKKVPALENVLDGKLLYLKMVKGETDSTYKELGKRFAKLAGRATRWSDKESFLLRALPAEIESTIISSGIPIADDASATDIDQATKSLKPKIEDIPHNPERVVELLKKFNKKGSVLRETVHVWDSVPTESNQTIKDFYDALYQTYREMIELQKFNHDLWWTKVYRFVYQKNLYDWQKREGFSWGRHHLKIGWNYPDTIAKWCNEYYDGKGNMARKPMAMELPEDLRPSERVAGRAVSTFQDVMLLFKSEIEFRDDHLYLMMKKNIRASLRDGDWTTDNAGMNTLDKTSFYTDTEKVERIVHRALEMINARPTYRSCSIRCYRDNHRGQYVLELLQYGSFSDRDLTSDKLANLYDGGDFQKLVDECISVCHLSVESRFRDEDGQLKSFELQLLYPGIARPFKWKKNPVDVDAEGFKFKFYFPD